MKDYNAMAIILKLKTIYKQKSNFDDYRIMGMKDFDVSSPEFQILLTCKNFINLFHLDEDDILNERNEKYVIRILEEETKNGTTFKMENTYFSIINSGVIYAWKKKIEEIFPMAVYENYWVDIYIYIVLSTFFHEICHVVHGHVLYYKQELNEDILFMEEEIDEIFPKAISLDRKTLEWDADCFSASKLMELLHNVNKKCVSEREIKKFLYAITIKFYDDGYYCNKKSNNYLHPLYRIVSYANAFYEHGIAYNYFEIDKSTYNELLISCINEIVSSKECRIDFAKILEDEYYEEINIRKNWKIIRNELSKLIGSDTFLPK